MNELNTLSRVYLVLYSACFHSSIKARVPRVVGIDPNYDEIYNEEKLRHRNRLNTLKEILSADGRRSNHESALYKIMNAKTDSMDAMYEFILELYRMYYTLSTVDSENARKLLKFSMEDIIPWKATIMDITRSITRLDLDLPDSTVFPENILHDICNAFSSDEEDLILMALEELILAFHIPRDTITSNRATPLTFFIEYAVTISGLSRSKVETFLSTSTTENIIESIRTKTIRTEPDVKRINDKGSAMEIYNTTFMDDNTPLIWDSREDRRFSIYQLNQITPDLIRDYFGDSISPEFTLTEEMVGYLIKEHARLAKVVNKDISYTILDRLGILYLLFRDPISISTIYGISLTSDPHTGARSCISIEIPKDTQLVLSLGGLPYGEDDS